MNRWAKIIEVLDSQVLFFMEPTSNDKEDTVTLHQMVHTNGVCCDSQIRNIPKADAEKIFKGLDEETAEMVVKTVEDLMEQNET